MNVEKITMVVKIESVKGAKLKFPSKEWYVKIPVEVAENVEQSILNTFKEDILKNLLKPTVDFMWGLPKGKAYTDSEVFSIEMETFLMDVVDSMYEFADMAEPKKQEHVKKAPVKDEVTEVVVTEDTMTRIDAIASLLHIDRVEAVDMATQAMLNDVLHGGYKKQKPVIEKKFTDDDAIKALFDEEVVASLEYMAEDLGTTPKEILQRAVDIGTLSIISGLLVGKKRA